MEEKEERRGKGKGKGLSYCVTGATGYIGSWLVKSLLRKGYTVHATLRDPAKALHLIPLWSGGDRLRVFRANLQEEGSFDEAVKGCSGVFHVAASMEFEVPANEDIDSYARANFIEPAISGTLNLLKSCSKTESVKRVVFTSSISTLTAKDSSGNWRNVVDESCQTPVDHVWKTKASGWIYVLSKLLTEEAAFQFAKQNKVDLVSVITTTVAGSFLTKTVPASVRVLLSPITGDPMFSNILIWVRTGDPMFSSILSAVNSRMGSIALVHVEDICSAHMFLMEHARAEGRYICSARSCVMCELVDHLAKEYPFSNLQRCALVEEEHGSVPSEISSKKLRDLGFSFKYGLEDIMNHTVNSSVDCGFLYPNVKLD
ncbi:putative anthocyanidin reductase isoform X2 [Rhododendron vialii]|uniref:putative anthocyanidin reductase isoform X2 n=1 Tax=Rhododendron vialii TaxID=182163 RepID=UPI00265E03D2|nr:putative anthocyanidin reductase isoform X2 [Rhododendron vialii]